MRAAATRLFRRRVALVSLAVLVPATFGVVAAGLSILPALAGTSKEHLSLVSQTDWVSPGQTFHAAVAVSGPTPTDDLSLQFSVYPELANRSSLALTFSNNESQAPVASSTVALSSISPTDDQAAMTVKVGLPGAEAPAAATGSPQLNLPCSGACEGVYPLQIALLTRSGGKVLTELTTELLVTVTSADPLRFSWVVPLLQPSTVNSRGQIRLGTNQLEEIKSLASTLNAIPLDAEPVLSANPATVAGLSASSGTRSAVLSALADWAQLPGDDTLLRPYAETDPSALAIAGLSGQWTSQLGMGRSTLVSALGAPVDPTTWVSDGPLDSSGAGLLPATTSRLVLPLSDLVPEVSNLTPDSTFTIKVAKRRFLAMSSDAGLESLIPTQASQAVLAAHHLMAELAQIYFESPNNPIPRGVMLVIPAGSSVPVQFLSTLATGLSASPVVHNLGLAKFFSQVNHSGSRRLLKSTQQSLPSLGSPELSASVDAVEAYSEAAEENPAAVSAISRILALSESVLISDNQRQALLGLISQILEERLNQVTLGSDRTLRLTSRTANIPLTLVSTSRWPLRLELRLSSPKLEFPGASGGRMVTVEPGRSNELNFRVVALTSGDLPLQVQLESPQGNLVFFDTRITVTSTAVSAVALVLTAGAAGYLLLWWGLSFRRQRRARNKRLVDGSE